MEITESLTEIDDKEFMLYNIKYEEQNCTCIMDDSTNTIRIKEGDKYGPPIEMSGSKKHMLAYCLNIVPHRQIIVIETNSGELIPINGTIHDYAKDHDIELVYKIHDIYFHSIDELKNKQVLESIVRQSEDEDTLSTTIASTFIKWYNYMTWDVNDDLFDELTIYKFHHRKVDIKDLNEILILMNSIQYEPTGTLSYIFSSFYKYAFNRFLVGKPVLFKHMEKLYDICKKVYNEIE